MSEFRKSLATMFASFLFCLLVIEIVLQFLPVRTGLEVQEVDADHPVIRFTPNRDFVFSDGWRLTNVNHGHVNNEGFVNDQDYVRDDRRPLLAIIGDSYIEAAMVRYKLTVQGRLAAEQPATQRVYSFGSSGSSLLDYLFYAVYARQHFHPDWVVINVVGNDFDEMLLRYKKLKAFHYLEEEPDGSFKPVLIEYHPSLGRMVLRHSALARYVILNLGVTPPWVARLLHGDTAALPSPVGSAFAADEPRYVGNTASDASAQRVELSKRAVDYVLDHLQPMTGLDPAHVLFMVDSYRIFDPATLATLRASYFGVMRDYFIAEARARGYEVQDLQDWFAARYARDGSAFSYPDDAHWNPIGHEEAANAIRASKFYARFTAQ